MVKQCVLEKAFSGTEHSPREGKVVNCSTLAVERDSYTMAVGVESHSAREDCEEMIQKVFDK
jgi:hypothetical protein